MTDYDMKANRIEAFLEVGLNSLNRVYVFLEHNPEMEGEAVEVAKGITALRCAIYFLPEVVEPARRLLANFREIERADPHFWERVESAAQEHDRQNG